MCNSSFRLGNTYIAVRSVSGIDSFLSCSAQVSGSMWFLQINVSNWVPSFYYKSSANATWKELCTSAQVQPNGAADFQAGLMVRTWGPFQGNTTFQNFSLTGKNNNPKTA